MDPVSVVRGKLAPIPQRDIDTDQITPARFLKMTGRDDVRLREALFHDWRFDEDGAPRPGFALNRPEHRGAAVLLAGGNFGCGSSREKAPWALLAAGFRAVISTSFAEIFQSNALKNGLLPVIVEPAVHEELFALAARDPSAEVEIDLAGPTISWPHGRATFPLDPFARACLLKGFDELDYIRSFEAAIAALEERPDLRAPSIKGAHRAR